MPDRPWRAAAFLGEFTGAPLMGRTSAKTKPGLDRFVAHWTDYGCRVYVWEVLPVPEVAAQVAAGLPG